MFAKFLVLSASFAIAAPALAVSVLSNETGAPDPWILNGPANGFNVVFDFETGWNTALNTIQVGEVFTGPQGLSVPSGTGRAAPAGTPAGGSYQSVGSSQSAAIGSSFFDFSSLLSVYRPYLTGFSLYWGSVDGYNTLEFYNSGGTLVGSVTGSAVSNPANGNQTIGQTNRRVTFGFTEAEQITGVKFLSSNDAFEFDNLAISSVVPEPASWAMLIAGFGLVGATMRRRRNQPGSVLA